MKSRKRITAETFIRIHQTSKTILEVMRRSGNAYRAVCARAWSLRAKGVPLKFFSRVAQRPSVSKKIVGKKVVLDIPRLKALAERYLQEFHEKSAEKS